MLGTYNRLLNLEGLVALVTTYTGKLILAVLTLIIGRKLIKYVMKLLQKTLEKSYVDKSLFSFFMSAAKAVLYILLVITIVSMVGIPMTSFIAVLGSAGLAVGLALQGSLVNLAGGVLILSLKPFKVGDYIDAVGHSGTVEEIQLFYTILNTPDNKRIFIPNGELANSSSTNYSAYSLRRVDLALGVSYDDDLQKVKDILYTLAQKHDLVLENPGAQVVVTDHADSSVNLSFRVWCNSSDYWTIYFDMMEKVKIEFDNQGINIPYPQMDVHVKHK